MAPAGRGLITFGREATECVGLDGPQEAETGSAAGVRDGDDEAPVGELQDIIKADRGIPGGLTHGVDLFDIEAALENGELVEHALEIRLEEVMAPADRSFEGLLATG